MFVVAKESQQPDWRDVEGLELQQADLTVLEFLPIAFAFHAEKVPAGSVWYRAALPRGSKPAMRVEIPKGLTPPLCVYFC